MVAPVALTGAGNVTNAVVGSGTTITVAKPSNTADGDLLVFVVGFQNNTGGTTPTVPTVAAGTVVRAGPAYNVTGDGNRRPSGIYFLPVASASALTDTTFTFTTTTGSGRNMATCFRVTGANLSTPEDSSGVWYSPSNTASQARALPGCTTNSADTLLVSYAHWNLNSSVPDTNTWTSPASEVDDLCTISSGTASHSTLSCAADQVASTGATGTRTVTISGTGTVANGAGYVVAIASGVPTPVQLTAEVIGHRGTTAASADTTEEQLTGLAILAALTPRVNGGEVDVRRPSDWATTGKSFLMHDMTPDRTSPNSSTGTLPATSATYTSWQMCELITWLDGWIDEPFLELLVQLEIDVQSEMVDPINECLAHPLKDRITIMTSATAGSTPRHDRIRAAGWTGKIGCYGVDSSTYSTYSSTFASNTVDLLFLPVGDSGYTAERSNIGTYHTAGYRVGASTITMSMVPTAHADGADVILSDYSEQFTTYLPPGNVLALTGPVAPDLTIAAPAGAVTVTSDVTAAGVLATVAITAPAGAVALISNITAAGPKSAVAVSAKAGTVALVTNVGLAGVVSTVAVGAPAGAVMVTSVIDVTIAGEVSAVTVAATAGSVNVSSSSDYSAAGEVAPVAVDAPAGVVSVVSVIDVTMAGALAGVVVDAPAGTVTTSSVTNYTAAGITSAVTVVASAGSVSATSSGADVTAAGPVSAVTIGAPNGSVAVASIIDVLAAGPPSLVDLAALAGQVAVTSLVAVLGPTVAVDLAAPAGLAVMTGPNIHHVAPPDRTVSVPYRPRTITVPAQSRSIT